MPVDRSRCASCGQSLTNGYYVLVDRPDRFCPQCIATRPRCDTCGAPLGNRFWQLHDGRRQCDACHAVAIYDPAQALQIFQQTAAMLVEGMGLQLNIGVAFRLVDAPTMSQLRGPLPRGQHTLGLYRRQQHIRVIYVLHGLPKLMFRITAAHEYAHAWQSEHCPLLQNEFLREGHAEWVAYHHLLQLGSRKAAARMLDDHHPYRQPLRYLLNLEAQLGTAGVNAYLMRVED
ncbi:TFIIB-type zinc finger domain-containing protein [Chloroflexus sp.]|uniref:TFIIB-type zinc finger domain-containing protein n=1 Tax=Chloroflexus sp. TaxID=1904827 RepID=UPI0026193602|nr:TFIIB-type zinc finger domain-containing protein [uncultured Chloroflexus sp.]